MTLLAEALRRLDSPPTRQRRPPERPQAAPAHRGPPPPKRQVAFAPEATHPRLPTQGAGAIVLFCDLASSPERPARAALAFLKRHASPDGDALLLEVQRRCPPPGSGPASDQPLVTREPDARVWRANIPLRPGASRLRDWVLLLDECRRSYYLTAIAISLLDAPELDTLATHADRAIAVARARRTPVTETSRMLRRLRRAGAARCECLWVEGD